MFLGFTTWMQNYLYFTRKPINSSKLGNMPSLPKNADNPKEEIQIIPRKNTDNHQEWAIEERRDARSWLLNTYQYKDWTSRQLVHLRVHPRTLASYGDATEILCFASVYVVLLLSNIISLDVNAPGMQCCFKVSVRLYHCPRANVVHLTKMYVLDVHWFACDFDYVSIMLAGFPKLSGTFP